MQFTENYNLRKIDLEDSPPDITVLNKNFDTIDEALQKGVDDLKTTNDNLTKSDEKFAEHVEYHVESHVVSQRVRGDNDPDYGII